MKSAVTVSLVEEARGGPFVFWDGIVDAIEQASELGFDAIEIFAPAPDAVDIAATKELLDEKGLAVAAVGTGAGMVKHGLTLSHADDSHRQKAVHFVKSMIDFGARWNAPAIIGSMQGRWGKDHPLQDALGYLSDSLRELAGYAAKQGQPLFYEPLNRYETNLLTTIGGSVDFLEQYQLKNVLLLADLFHMNIEESDVAEAIRLAASHLGHVHFVDSNRQAAGLGHTDFQPVIEALRKIQYSGYLCAEAFPIPDSRTAAQQTIATFKKFCT